MSSGNVLNINSWYKLTLSNSWFYIFTCSEGDNFVEANFDLDGFFLAKDHMVVLEKAKLISDTYNVFSSVEEFKRNFIDFGEIVDRGSTKILNNRMVESYAHRRESLSQEQKSFINQYSNISLL